MNKYPFFPSEYVAVMAAHLNLSLTAESRKSYVNAVEYVALAGKRRINLQELHSVLMEGEPTAGQYRQSVVICAVTGRVKEFPQATTIPQLLYSFTTAYRNALSKKAGFQNPEQLETQAWLVAAGGRCLHPFVIGNTRLFCLIENHIRIQVGLPWTTCFRPQEQFHQLRAMYKKQNEEHY